MIIFFSNGYEAPTKPLRVYFFKLVSKFFYYLRSNYYMSVISDNLLRKRFRSQSSNQICLTRKNTKNKNELFAQYKCVPPSLPTELACSMNNCLQ